MKIMGYICVVDEFRRMLKTGIDRRREAGDNMRDVAGKYGGTQGTISNVISGRHVPPPSLLEGWSKLFDTPTERALFIRLGHLAHATPEVLAIVADLECMVTVADQYVT